MSDPGATAGIYIDTWKLPIFQRHLHLNGFRYTQHLAPAPDTLLLQVKTNNPLALREVIRDANAECRFGRASPI
jgi:hypothetical protein